MHTHPHVAGRVLLPRTSLSVQPSATGCLVFLSTIVTTAPCSTVPSSILCTFTHTGATTAVRIISRATSIVCLSSLSEIGTTVERTRYPDFCACTMSLVGSRTNRGRLATPLVPAVPCTMASPPSLLLTVISVPCISG